MLKVMVVVLALAGAVSVSGCVPVGYGGIGAPAVGILYTEVYGPISAGDKVGAKEGVACVQSILGLVATGNASIKEAARDGSITKIDSVDHYTQSILGVVAKFCTIVRGS